jgi:DNA-binding LytR/AlgR family response regulator
VNCVVINSNKIQEQLINSYVEKTDALNLLGSFSDILSAFKNINESKVDVLFLDEDIARKNGFEFTEKYNLDKSLNIILTANNSNSAIKAFEIGVVDYLLKPISYSRFSKTIARVITKNKDISFKNDFMFIKSKGLYIKIKFQEITCIKSSFEYVIIHTLDKKYMVYSSMSKILKKMPYNFIQVHRSNIVSLDKIDKIDGNLLDVGGQIVKVSKMYKSILMYKLGIS